MGAAVVVGVVLAGILLMAWFFARANEVLADWARENGYEIVHKEYRLLRKGPFFIRSGRGHAVFYVTVREREGRIRRAWVRCGSWWTGLLSDKVTVEWDEWA